MTQDSVNQKIDASNATENKEIAKRQIKSFVLRQGRLTKGQQAALDNLWPIYGIEYNPTNQLDFGAIFTEQKQITLEIGFGMGASLVEMAKNSPQEGFIGIEVHKPGVGACLMAIDEEKITNLRVLSHDAVEVIENMIKAESLDKVQIFFPDPWHKARHNKRRIIQPEFVQLLRQKLKIGGVLHLATDWQEYAEHMLEVLTHAEGFKNLAAIDYIPKPDYRPTTKFERRGQNLGHGVWDLQFERVS